MPSSVVRSDRICHFQQVTCQPIWHQRVCVCCVWRRKCCVVLSAALRFNFCANRFDRSFMCLPLHTQMIWFDMMWHWHTLAVNCQPTPYSFSFYLCLCLSPAKNNSVCHVKQWFQLLLVGMEDVLPSRSTYRMLMCLTRSSYSIAAVAAADVAADHRSNCVAIDRGTQHTIVTFMQTCSRSI